MTVNDEFWEAMGLQLMAYKRVLNCLLHAEVPEDILQEARSGSSYFQDGHFTTGLGSSSPTTRMTVSSPFRTRT